MDAPGKEHSLQHSLANDAIEALQAKVGINDSAVVSSLDYKIRNLLPTGLICMWAGLLSEIPDGWQICDGSNGSPDLRSKFIKGSAVGVDPGVTGGAATHTHTTHAHTPAGTVSVPDFTGTLGTVSAVSAGTPAGTVTAPDFTGAEATVSSVSAGTPEGTNTAPVFTGTPIATTTPVGAPAIAFAGAGATAASAVHTHTVTPAGTVSAPVFAGTPMAGHEHTVTAEGTNSVPTFTGSALATHQHTLTPAGTISQPTFTGNATTFPHNAVSNEPEYYALAFIMKL